MKCLQYIYIIVLLIGLAPTCWATHIVGGELNYRCLGNNRYEVSLTVFRDCDTGVPYFDDPAAIGVFENENNQLVQDLRVPMQGIDDTLEMELQYPCLVAPPNVCIHRTTYLDTITLLPRTGGYTLAYQRCCRNHSIVNLTQPDSTGATYSVYISEAALNSCNSGPQFKEWPPFYLCVGIPIDIDQGGVDADGDSIVYELCNPIDYPASSGSPRPQPINNPPYFPVNWAPGYSTSNMLGGTDPLIINSQTGQLIGTPSISGVFVVGICMKEYRNGVLLTEVRRDFQFISGACGKKALASFDTTAFDCLKDSTVQLLNTGVASTGTYLWDFGDGTTSTQANPIHTFPDTGWYDIVLISNPGDTCSDTLYQRVRLDINALDFSLPSVYNACKGDSLLLTPIIQTNPYLDSSQLVYEWFPDTSVILGQGTDSAYFFPRRTMGIKLRITNKSCRDSAFTTIVYTAVNADFYRDSIPCKEALDVQFSTSNNGFGTYLWDFGDGNSSTLANPLHLYDSTGIYEVQLIINANNCIDTTREIIIVDTTSLPILLAEAFSGCSGDTLSVVLDTSAVLGRNLSYTWSPASLVVQGQGTPVIGVSGTDKASLTLSVQDESGCERSFTTELIWSGLEVDFEVEPQNCLNQYGLQILNLSNTDAAYFNWSFGNGDNSTSYSPFYQYTDTGTYQIDLQVRDVLGCEQSLRKSVQIQQLGIEANLDDIYLLCKYDTIQLKPSLRLYEDSSEIQYLWSTALPIIEGQNSDSILLYADKDDVVELIVQTGKGCTDTVQATVNITKQTPALAITANPTVIYKGTESQLLATEEVNYVYEWRQDSALSALNIFNPTVGLNQVGRYTYYLQVENNLGCFEVDSIQVEVIARCADPLVFIPNAFTPNGDGQNDVFRLRGNDITDMYLVVYNRWGEAIFESTEQTQGWDGTHQGKRLPSDVYGFYVRCTCAGGEVFEHKGNVSLLN